MTTTENILENSEQNVAIPIPVACDYFEVWSLNERFIEIDGNFAV